MPLSTNEKPAFFAPMTPVSLGTAVQRGFSLYTSQLGWFAAAGLAVSGLHAAFGYITAGWALILGLMILVPTKLGLYHIARATARGEQVDFSTMVRGFSNPSAYVVGLIETTLLIAGLLLFVAPMFWVAFAISWTTPALASRKLGAIAAIKRSFKLAHANLGLTVGVMLCGVVLELLADSTIVVGALTAPLLACIKIVLFEQIDDTDGEA